MQAIILLGHGSRVPGASKDMENVATGLRDKYHHPLVEFCHMSQLGPHFPEAFEKCVRQGATEVLVLPYFLHMGQHLCADIPRILREQGAKFPHVKIVLGKNLGYDPVLVDLMEKRIGESLSLPDVRDLPLETREDVSGAHQCGHGVGVHSHASPEGAGGGPA
ncbi:MAG: CbiX/SirB N-terminal domain-containing protein [Planctomycetota bacterium]